MWYHIKLADIYCRLSDEEKKHGNESESITNQRAIIRDYCKKHDIIIVKEFVDDGYSGGNFERPGFQAMLNHLAGGKVNMVITKDLSRPVSYTHLAIVRFSRFVLEWKSFSN